MCGSACEQCAPLRAQRVARLVRLRLTASSGRPRLLPYTGTTTSSTDTLATRSTSWRSPQSRRSPRTLSSSPRPRYGEMFKLSLSVSVMFTFASPLLAPSLFLQQRFSLCDCRPCLGAVLQAVKRYWNKTIEKLVRPLAEAQATFAQIQSHVCVQKNCGFSCSDSTRPQHWIACHHEELHFVLLSRFSAAAARRCTTVHWSGSATGTSSGAPPSSAWRSSTACSASPAQAPSSAVCLFFNAGAVQLCSVQTTQPWAEACATGSVLPRAQLCELAHTWEVFVVAKSTNPL